MGRRIVLTAIVVSLTLTAAGALAEDKEEALVESVIKACQKEIETYCRQVTPGEGRLLACFYAHGDKISGRCEFALYNAAAELEQFAAALTHLAASCHDDLMKHCAEVEIGEGRVGACLLEHKDVVTETCRRAMDDVELEAVESRAGAGATEAPAGGNGAGQAEVPPELLAEIVADLVARTGAERSQVEVLRAEAVTWRDSSLGCPEPGMMYSQALTEGYWVVLGHAGEEHDYRARQGGSFLLCERPDRVGPLESAT